MLPKEGETAEEIEPQRHREHREKTHTVRKEELELCPLQFKRSNILSTS
jgi:hypothetical protein